MTKGIEKTANEAMIPQGLPVANLQTIDLGLLQEGHNGEIRRLLEACRESGIFYLNFQCIEEKMSAIIDALYDLTRSLYDMPYEEKMLYDVDKLCKMKCNGYVTDWFREIVSLIHVLPPVTSRLEEISEASLACVMDLRHTQYELCYLPRIKGWESDL